MNELMNLGVGGAVIVLVIKEMFVFLKGDKKSEGSLAMSQTLTAMSKVLDNSTLMLQLVQERMRSHEENAHNRHIELNTKIDNHGLECRSQAIRIQEKIK
jgi:hypothetical protein